MAHARHAVDGHALRVEADADHVVNVDARLAAVALSHLLENAARYSPADRDIVVDARSGADGVTVSVTDRGPGLDPGEIDHLFERFYRGRHAQQTAPGTGMGLAIASGLLKAIGGQGLGREHAGRRRAVFDGRARRESAGRRQGLSMPPRILIVDDEPNILGTLAPILRDRGYEVFTAMSGRLGARNGGSGASRPDRARSRPARH